MWLETLHVFGLTNLTDEQVVAFEAIESPRRARSSEGDILNLSFRHEKYAHPSSLILTLFSLILKLIYAKGYRSITAAFLGAVYFLSLIEIIHTLSLLAEQKLVSATINVILLSGLFICIFSIGLSVIGHVVTDLMRKDRTLNNSGPDDDDTEGSPSKISGPDK